MVIARSRGVFLDVRYVLCICVYVSVKYACNGFVSRVCVCVCFWIRVYLHCLSYSLRFVEYVSTV